MHSQSIFSQRQSQLLPNIQEFGRVLEDVGVTLVSTLEHPHALGREQALIVRELAKYFQNNDPQLCTKFLFCLKYLCKKEKHLKKFLLPTQFQKSSDRNSLIYQDSLFSLFLKVPRLQDDIIELLLENITAVSMEETQDTSWLRTLLKPLRCLPTIKNEELLAKKLLDILEISTFACQLEILEALPEILPDNQCDLAAKQLTRLLDENDELCGAIVDCLTALNLNAEIRAQIHDRILAKVLAGISLKVYLILIKFLLSDYKSQNLVPTLLKIRNSLENIAGGHSKEKESDKTVIFHYLQSSAVTLKPVAEGWLNTISNIKVHADHKPIDLLIMFMLHHTSEIRKRSIEVTFRKRVSAGLFKIGLVDKVLEKYMTQQILKDYMVDVIEIGCYLLRFSKDGVVAKFATSLFETLFNHMYTGVIYRGEILSKLISLTGSYDHYTINTVLKLILSLVTIDSQKVETHISLLMQLLEKLDSFEYKDVKIVFDILCSLVCGGETEDFLSGFKDQIFNTIRKLLSCCERSVKHRGIVSAIIMVKHTASVDSEQADVSLLERSTTVTGLPNGSPKEAAELLELVNCATGDNPELLCLYYDQLASILASDQLFDKYFLYWLYKQVEDDFETTFVTDTIPASTNDLKFSRQYELNSRDEVDGIFAINIAGYAICDKNDKIFLLAAYFRVLRLLHFRQHEHLGEIDSLLGCGVILPDIDSPDDLEPDQVRQVADCLFHCVNWFREIISGFVSQKGAKIQAKVVKRLENLIEVENKLLKFLKQIPGHNLPLSYFDSVQNVSKQLVAKVDPKNKKNTKKIKSVSILSDTIDLSANSQDASKSSTLNSKKLSAQNHKIQFREIDTDIIRLIRYPLDIHKCNEAATHTKTISLSLHQVKFILDDFISKLTLLTQNKDMGLSHLNDVNPEHLVQDCVHIVQNLDKIMEVTEKKITDLLEEPEGACYTEEANDIKSCFGNILEIFYLIFQWSGFQHTGNFELLRNILRGSRDANSQISSSKLILNFVVKISDYSSKCLHLSNAVSLIKAMNALHSLAESSKEIERKISSTAERFLSKRWYDFMGKLDHGQTCNRHMDVLVKAYLKNANATTISAIVIPLVDDIDSLQSKDGYLTKYPAIDSKNFHVFYLGLCNALLNTVKFEIHSLTNLEHLFLWDSVAVTLTKLMIIAKDLKSRNNLSCFLKKTIGILKIFLSHGIPIMEIMFKSKSTEVIKILKTIQSTTRFLHHLCCQSKVTRDASVVSHIPSFRHTLESIVYRVKAAFVANDCTSGFRLGTLRNRDMDGEEILSQSTVISSSEGSSQIDNELLPSDDNEDDAMIINNEYSDNDESVESEVYG